MGDNAVGDTTSGLEDGCGMESKLQNSGEGGSWGLGRWGGGSVKALAPPPPGGLDEPHVVGRREDIRTSVVNAVIK